SSPLERQRCQIKSSLLQIKVAIAQSQGGRNSKPSIPVFGRGGSVLVAESTEIGSFYFVLKRLFASSRRKTLHTFKEPI
ncbi:MAG: hypothetical protein P1V21_26135, partial [Rhizobiaceae bacterium]|nr:hypothetical protein [Rhizobiaceae bacterium]